MRKIHEARIIIRNAERESGRPLSNEERTQLLFDSTDWHYAYIHRIVQALTRPSSPLIIYMIRHRDQYAGRLQRITVLSKEHCEQQVIKLIAEGCRITSIKRRSQYFKGLDIPFEADTQFANPAPVRILVQNGIPTAN